MTHTHKLILALLFFISTPILVTKGEYSLVWEDTFDGTTLDEVNNWSIEVNGNGGGNNELQYYRRENISVGEEPISGDNCLIITAKKEDFLGKSFTSGRLTTQNKIAFKYGKIEARIKLPKTANGLWPAFWMMGADYKTQGWPKCGEIDILEMGNASGIANSTQDRYFNSWFHWGESSASHPNWGKNYTHPTGIQDDFFLFTLIWDDESLKTYFGTDDEPLQVKIVEMAINGEDVLGETPHYFHKPFFVLFNLAIGGKFTGITNINNISALNAENNYEANMYVDYVKVYQQGVIGEEFIIKNGTGNKQISFENKYKVYPNPAENMINITGENELSEVLFFNISGQEVKRTSQKNSIDISSLSAGSYILKIKDKNGNTENQHLIKNYHN